MFPLYKLLSLSITKSCEIISGLIRNQTLHHPSIRKMCILISKPLNSSARTETEKIEIGSALLSEIILYGSAVGLLIWEHNRSEDKIIDERVQLYNKLEEIQQSLNQINGIIPPSGNAYVFTKPVLPD